MKKFVFWFFLVLLVIIRIFTSQNSLPDGTKIKITSKVVSEVIEYSKYQRIILEGYAVYLPAVEDVEMGDKLVVEGVVEKGKLKDVVLIKKEKGSNNLYRIRQQILSFYQKVMPTPFSGLLGGMVLGSKSGISNDFWQVLRNTGTAHVVVASGMNVSLMVNLLISFLVLFVSRKYALVLTTFGIFIYASLTGFEAPIVRASIMTVATFGAQILGRRYSASRILFLTAILMLLYKPLWLKDLGFILSFASTLTILLFDIKINRLLWFVHKIFRESVSTSLAAQIGVAPIIFLTFNQFNILSPLINGIILWTVPLVTIFGAIAGILSLIFPFLAKILLYLIFPLMWFFVTIVKIFA